GVSIWGAIAGGFAGTLVLTTALRAANELNLTRMDLPFLLGTAFTDDRTRAKALGYVLHFLVARSDLRPRAWPVLRHRSRGYPASARSSAHGHTVDGGPIGRPARAARVPDAQLRGADAARQPRRPHRLRNARGRIHLPGDLTRRSRDQSESPLSRSSRMMLAS